MQREKRIRLGDASRLQLVTKIHVANAQFHLGHSPCVMPFTHGGQFLIHMQDVVLKSSLTDITVPRVFDRDT
jgi:hypothetical protein